MTGPAELLVRRRGEQLVEELRAEGEIELVDVNAGELRSGELPDLRTGSLVGARRVVVVRRAGELAASEGKRLLAELEAGPLDATVILLATSTGNLPKELLAQVKELGGRIDERLPPEYRQDAWHDIIVAEFRRHGREATRAAVEVVSVHAGTDVDVIAEKVAQACATAPAGTIGAEHVEAVVTGHGSRGSFAVADAMCRRQPEEAVALLRGALEAGDDPVLILGALVYRLRGIVAVAGKIDQSEAGLSISAGQQRLFQRDRHRFGPGELTVAYRVLADADAELKGGELPPELVLERAVAAVATPLDSP